MMLLNAQMITASKAAALPLAAELPSGLGATRLTSVSVRVCIHMGFTSEKKLRKVRLKNNSSSY